MRTAPLVIGAVLVALSLTGCATAGDGVTAPGSAGPRSSGEPTTGTPGTDDSGGTSGPVDAAARERAQGWLDAASLPPGAIPAEPGDAAFSSYTGWPCGPVEELEAFWSIPGATVNETANWLQQNPTADLLSTALAPVPDEPLVDSAHVGYVPAPDSHEGIVYTVMRTLDGVAVRAEIAALTESAECPALPDGGTRGAPGQG
ncbi:hypothetical protein ACFP63_06115 [Oerskovia jenensis]|uniref:Lipoprotein n=1 Tax=Oerskovia jenensis TaxID=162169 RepID=A0ABS2LGR7_9CELL|nr:hypothetical protein [Oerskovia jenensis]MBM7479621.1 hypothetical protein [Oerskovia jenensis]